MQISWLGEAGIRLQVKDTVVLIDPPDNESGFGPSKQTAQVVALTERDGRDWKSLGGEPFVIETPGEFERQNVFFYGISLPGDPDRVHFRIEAEEMRLGHLGGLSGKLDNEQMAQFEGVDILFVPVGGKSVLDAETAASLISQIEPRIVIPIQYKVKGGTAAYSDASVFLKEIGAKSTDAVDKLKITKKELPADETQVIILNVS